MDLAADPRSFSMGYRAALPDPRSRRRLWRSIPVVAECHGDRRGLERPALTLAERLCRTGHRFDPTRLPRSRHRPEQTSLAAALVILPGVLPPIPDPPLSERIARSRAGCSRPTKARSSPFRRSADFIIATSGWLPEHIHALVQCSICRALLFRRSVELLSWDRGLCAVAARVAR